MENCNIVDIGKRIKEQRKKNNLTQEELAALLMVSREKVNYWEVGSRDIKTGDLISLAKALNTTSDYLLGIERGTTPEISALIDTIGLSETSIVYLSDNKNAQTRRLFDFLIDRAIEDEQEDMKEIEAMESCGVSAEDVKEMQNTFCSTLSLLDILCRVLDVANASNDIRIDVSPDGEIDVVNISESGNLGHVKDHHRIKMEKANCGSEMVHNISLSYYISDFYINMLSEKLREYHRKCHDIRAIY